MIGRAQVAAVAAAGLYLLSILGRYARSLQLRVAEASPPVLSGELVQVRERVQTWVPH